MPSHRERRQLPYCARRLFDLVADVEKYPEFIEWFVAVRIRRREGNVLEVDQVVRFKGLRARFVTRAVLDPPRRIEIACQEPPFKRFDQLWTFLPAPKGGTIVEYASTLELSSSLLQHAMQALFDERQVAVATVDALARRAQQIYGIAPQDPSA
ncbi:MAG: type II toxin-antitoxin system RatA family toxin [Alphaproteobacteria bacterium]